MGMPNDNVIKLEYCSSIRLNSTEIQNNLSRIYDLKKHFEQYINILISVTGSNYAMMASYLASAGHVPDALKHLLPDMQQYWSVAHQES